MKCNLRKSDGFVGEQIIDIPKSALAKCAKLPLIATLYIVRMGFYPKAKNHYFKRPNGISQTLLIYCTVGIGWLKLNDIHININAGQAVLIPSCVAHSYGADAINPWTIYWFHLTGSGCIDLVNVFSVAEEVSLRLRFLKTG